MEDASGCGFGGIDPEVAPVGIEFQFFGLLYEVGAGSGERVHIISIGSAAEEVGRGVGTLHGEGSKDFGVVPFSPCLEPPQEWFNVDVEEQGGEAISLDSANVDRDGVYGTHGVWMMVWAPVYRSLTVSMASVGNPRSYMIWSILSWSGVSNASERSAWSR